METIGESLRQYWLKQGIKLKSGASEIELLAFENKYNVHLPEDLKDYFSTVNGFDDSDVDGEFITFLTLDEIESLSINWSQAPEAKSYFIFADYCISCHVYAIKLTKDTKFDNPVFIDFNDNKNPTQIADSFSEFAQSYLKNDYKVLF
jgi:cell wall assembly regulator SMI1